MRRTSIALCGVAFAALALRRRNREDKMKRIIIITVLIVSILAGSVLSLWFTKRTIGQMHVLEESIRTAQENGKSMQTETERFCRYWDRCYDKLSLIENSDELEIIDESISRLNAIAENSPEEMNAELDSICRQLDMLYQNQLPSFYSVF